MLYYSFDKAEAEAEVWRDDATDTVGLEAEVTIHESILDLPGLQKQ